MKRRVAVVLPYFGIGGAENVVSRVVSNFDLNVLDVEVICLYGKPLGNYLEKAILDHGIGIKYIGKGKGFSLSAIVKLWKELSKFKPNVINTHLSACVYTIPWALFHNRIMLHTVHNIPERELIRIKQIPMKYMYRFGKAVPIAISREIKERLKTYYQLKKEPELIYNPVDIERFERKKIPHEGIVIVTAGRLSEQKNQKVLIKVVGELNREFKNLRLIILGDGPLRNDLNQYIEQSGLKDIVELVGNVDNIEEYYAAADLFALSSAYEGVPLVILEAMASGLPIISTDVGGIRDVLSDGGILVKSTDEDQYRNELRRLIDSEIMRDELGRMAHDSVSKFDSSVISRQYMNVFSKYSQ